MAEKIVQAGGTPDKLHRNTCLKRSVINIAFYGCGIVLAFVFLFPLLYMISTSGKSETSYVASAGTIRMLFPDFGELSVFAENYKKVFTEYGIWQYALNSFMYAVVVIVCNIIVNGLAGYVLAKFDFPGKGFVMFIIMFLIVAPVETSIVSLYTIVKVLLKLTAEASVLGVILPATISVFNIFLFIQFFEGIPSEYEEAARLDGAGNMRIFFSIILPLSKPIVATVATFCFIGVWNDYIWPTMVLPMYDVGAWPLYPIQTKVTTIKSIPGITTSEVMAALVITSIPIFIVYVVAQKYIVQGFGSAGLKM